MGKKLFALAAAVGLVGLTARQASAELLYATSGTSISRFDSGSLGSVTTVPVVGLQGGETLVGIDVRPLATNPALGQVLYGVGSTSRVYTINPLTGLATQVGTQGAFTLNGTFFGTDFNPVPDRIRQVSNTEQSLRLNPNDASLSGTDTALNPAGNIVGVAYDRNYPRLTGDATPTTLFGIDSAAGTLVRIGGINGSPSPNLGEITTIGSLGAGTNLNEAIGFDISGLGTSQANPTGGGIAYATITVGGQSRLYTINLATGNATNLGQIGTGTTSFLGLAAASAPEPTGLAVLAPVAAFFLGRRRGRRPARG